MNNPSTSSNKPSRSLSFTALALGAVSLVSAIVFVTTSAGPILLYIGATAGLLALIVGIIALKQNQPKGPAITGLVVGSIVLLLSLALYVFALLFIGAFTVGNV